MLAAPLPLPDWVVTVFPAPVCAAGDLARRRQLTELVIEPDVCCSAGLELHRGTCSSHSATRVAVQRCRLKNDELAELLAFRMCRCGEQAGPQRRKCSDISSRVSPKLSNRPGGREPPQPNAG